MSVSLFFPSNKKWKMSSPQMTIFPKASLPLWIFYLGGGSYPWCSLGAGSPEDCSMFAYH